MLQGRGQHRIKTCVVQNLSAPGAPLQQEEVQAIVGLPGLSAWQAAAAAHAAPDIYDWDVFISHAGNSADKRFAEALDRLLEHMGWGLRVFMADKSLVEGLANPAGAIDVAMKSTAIAVVLFSAEFFVRDATKAEVEVLMARLAQHHVQLLPVFLRITVEDCKRSLAHLLGKGAHITSTMDVSFGTLLRCTTAILQYAAPHRIGTWV